MRWLYRLLSLARDAKAMSRVPGLVPRQKGLTPAGVAGTNPLGYRASGNEWRAATGA